MSVEFRETQPGIALPTKQARTRAELGLTILQDVRLLLIAVWLGAAVFFSIAVAPSAFAVLPARELAGNVVNRTLGILNSIGLTISLFLLTTAYIGRAALSRRARVLETAALAIVALTTFVGQWVIGARLSALRAAMGRPIDELAANDPLRVAFNSLHGYSVLVLLVGMIAAMVALLVIARRRVK